MCPITGRRKTKKALFTHAISSSIAPVLHCKDLLIPEPPVLESSSSVSTSFEEDTNAYFDKTGTSKKPHFPNQQEMDDLIQNMELTKETAKLFTSRQKEWHLPDSTCKVSKYRKRYLSFAHFLPFHNLIFVLLLRHIWTF